jgi:hypothetical protein
MKIQADATITYCTYCLLPPNGPFADEVSNIIIIHTAAKACPRGQSATRAQMR